MLAQSARKLKPGMSRSRAAHSIFPVHVVAGLAVESRSGDDRFARSPMAKSCTSSLGTQNIGPGVPRYNRILWMKLS